MHSVEGVLRLATKTNNIPRYSPVSSVRGALPENNVVVGGTNELKIVFLCHIYYHTVLVYNRKVIYLGVSG